MGDEHETQALALLMERGAETAAARTGCLVTAQSHARTADGHRARAANGHRDTSS